MWLSDLSIRRPVFAVMLIGALVALGWLSLDRLGLDLFPKIDLPYVSVTTVLEGATPESVETEVTEIIEGHLNTISGIESLRSKSQEGVSRVDIEFAVDGNVDFKAQDVREKLDLAQAELPLDAETPIVEKLDMDATPIISVMIAGDQPILELTQFANDVVKEHLERLDGVGAVTVVGGREREIRVWLDAFRLRAYKLTSEDIVQAIRREHAEIPGGALETQQRTTEYSFKTMGKIRSVQGFGEIVIAYRNAAPVRLRDVARVEDGLEDERTYAALGSERGIALLVRRQSGTNTVEVARAVKDEVARIAELTPPGVRIIVTRDMSRFIEASIHDTAVDMIFGGFLAMLVTFAFLRSWRSTLIVALAIPSSIISTFFFFSLFGFTLNMLTLMGLSVSIGILIDDAIVVLENIYRHIEAGTPPMEAASVGTREVGGAVSAATLAIAAVFVPIVFIEGTIGRFFYEYALAVTFAIFVSLLVALTLTPTLCARTLRRETHRGRAFEAIEGALVATENTYRTILAKSLASPAAVMGIALVMTFVGVQAGRLIPLEFSDSTDRSEYSAVVELPMGTGIEQTKRTAHRVTEALVELDHVETVFSTIGGSSGAGVNEIDLYVGATQKKDRSVSLDELMDRSRGVIAAAAPDATETSVNEIFWITGAGYGGSTMTYSIRGPDLERLQSFALSLAEKMRAEPIFVDAHAGFKEGKPEVQAQIDRQRAAELGIGVRQIASTMRTLVGGVKVATYEEDGEQHDVRVRLEEGHRDDLTKLGLLQIRGAKGQLADLESLARLEIAAGPSEIDRDSRSREVQVLTNLKPGVALGTAATRLDELSAELGMPAEYSGHHLGSTDRMRETAEAILLAFFIAILSLYMVLASQFNSFVQPAVIMLCAPLSLAGAFVALALSPFALSLFVQIGFIILLGLVMKNGILLVDYANQLMEQGLSPAEAMLRAAPVRLRPVLMTTLSTVGGMIPVALSSSDGSEMRQPMGILVIGGLISSMLLTMIVVPVAFTYAEAMRAWFRSATLRFQGSDPDTGSSDTRKEKDAA